MNETILAELCEMIKRKCRITWSDAETEARVEEIAENANATLRHKLGVREEAEELFLRPGSGRTLFEAYCMYDWNDALEEFDTNYKKEIIAERHKYEVKYAKENAVQQL